MTMPSDELLAAARAARDQAYAPFSHFPVGAAVRAEDGRIFFGCNIENSSYGLTICAERVALFSAVAAGARRIAAVAVVAGEGDPVMPCGACRQTLAEFGPGMAVTVAAADPAHPPVHTTLAEILPYPFILAPES